MICETKGAFGWYELEQDSPEQRGWLGLHLFWVGQNLFCLCRIAPYLNPKKTMKVGHDSLGLFLVSLGTMMFQSYTPGMALLQLHCAISLNCIFLSFGSYVACVALCSVSDCFCLRSATTHTAVRTRSQSIDSLALPKARNRYGLFALSFLPSDRWNSLPADIRSCSSLSLFRKSVRDHIGYPVKKALGLWGLPYSS